MCRAADEISCVSHSTLLGANTTGSWSFYFDGSDEALDTTNGEDVDGIWMMPASRFAVPQHGE